MSFELSELDRRLANIVRVGKIAALDEANALVRVEVGGALTDWLPWITHRAGPNRTWHAPEVGEQVLVLSPSGDLAQGIVLPAIYQDTFDQPENEKEKHRIQYADGAFIQYDRAGHHWHLDVPAAGSITLHIGNTTLLLENNKATLTTPELLVDSPQSTFTGNVTIEGLLTYLAGMIGSGDAGGGNAASITGTINVTGGNVIADGIGLDTHQHSGVQTGGGSTGGPFD